VQIRELTTLAECRQVAALERVVWGYTDSEDVVPPPVLIVSVKRGGILLGGFDRHGVMKGFVYSMAGAKNGRLIQWSHMLGVTADARNSGLGLQLKLAQRERATAMGVDLIEWTFDPLQALNAHFNFSKLGVIVEEYEENVYGESSSPLHQGSPTDRFIAEWRLRSAARPVATPPEGPPVNRAIASGPRLLPGEADLSRSDDTLLVDIPGHYDAMLTSDSALALEWRLSTRRVFQHYFSRGYRAIDFALAADRSRGTYLLSRR
jgi:predicted GNAT superfamily acetyltransferase